MSASIPFAPLGALLLFVLIELVLRLFVQDCRLLIRGLANRGNPRFRSLHLLGLF